MIYLRKYISILDLICMKEAVMVIFLMASVSDIINKLKNVCIVIVSLNYVTLKLVFV